jgi:hypothetical protein
MPNKSPQRYRLSARVPTAAAAPLRTRSRRAGAGAKRRGAAPSFGARLKLFGRFLRDTAWPLTCRFLDRLGLWARIWGAAVLIPCWLISLLCLGRLFSEAATPAFFRNEAFQAFALGVVAAAIQFFRFKRPVYLYVLGHEATHALFAKLCGGKVLEFNVSRTGGHVVISKNNWLISLSPYFFPIFVVAAALLFSVLGKITDLQRPLLTHWSVVPVLKGAWCCQFILGALWCYHCCFTYWMIRREQPDLTMNDRFFSLNVIVLANLLLLCGTVAVVTPHIGWGGLVELWLGQARMLLEVSAELVVRIFGAWVEPS